MTPALKSTFVLGHRHLLGIEGLSADDITGLLDLSEEYVELNRQVDKKRASLRGRTQINLFFEASTRTQSSFELAGKRLGADVMNMSVSQSSIRKGETLMDTAVTLNAMHPDILVVRHHASGAVELLARKVDGSVINAGDGSHEHPTQALLDALTIRRNKGRLEGLVIAICGDVMHSRVARSNILLLNTMGARVRVVAPSTLLPRGIERMGVEVARDMREGLNGADIVMMLRLQRERMNGSFVPSTLSISESQTTLILGCVKRRCCSIFSARSESRRCTSVTDFAKLVRKSASSTAVLPPPTMATSLPR